jgi:pimeloyl-ACP methyl ester carboxylesterase
MADALGVRPVVVAAAGHLTAVEAPAVVADALADLVRRAAG